jgi:hypothetical protein
MALPRTILNGFTGKLSPSKSSRELKKNYMALPLTISDGTSNRISPSKSSKELEKIAWLCH